jgi:hypothetical protein
VKHHVSRSVLRRLQDEPDAAPERDRRHAATCAACQRRAASLAANATRAAGVLAPGPEGIDLPYALRQLRGAETAVVPPRPRSIDRLRVRLEVGRRRAFRAAAVTTVVALCLGTLVASGAASSLIKIFEPDTFVAFPINLSSFSSMPDLSGFGSTQVLKTPTVTTTASQAAAAGDTGLALLTPGSLPSSVKGSVTYLAITQGVGSFTFNQATAAGTVNKLGRALPPLPKGLDGSSLTLQAGPAVVETVGSESGSGLLGAVGAGGASGPPVGPPTSFRRDGGHSGSAAGALRTHGMLAGLGGIPQLVIVQMKAPVLYSDGPSVTQYEDALLSMPGVPPSVAAEIRSLGNLSSTLPIPIPSSLASSSAADINGSPGLVIGDTTGIASGVIWQSHGLVYAVIGALTDHQVVAIARSMH